MQALEFLTKDDKIDIISQLKDSGNEVIKWMFIFWMNQLIAIAGLMKLIL
jgi:hypothetical protein